MINRLPSVTEVRRLIEAIGDDVDPREDKRVSYETDLEQIKMALKFQFLVAGISSEVAGIYRPQNTPLQNAYKTTIFGDDAVIFILRKSRQSKQRKDNELSLIGPCIPLKKEYEPWSKDVMDYVIKHPNPFTFVENPLSNKRILEAATTYIFSCLNWNNAYYPEFIKYKNIENEWKPFTTSCIRKSRIVDLLHNYNFDESNIRSFTSILTDYEKIDISDTTSTLDYFIRTAESYFHRLRVPRYK